MSSTFTCPIRINKYNNPTNDGTIAADNTGAAECTVQAAIAGTTPVAIVIPAGSIVSGFKSYMTTAAGSPSAKNVTIGTDVVATLSDAAGVNSATLGTSSTAVGRLVNVGTSDVTIGFTAGASSVGVFSVTYTPRNADGTITPYGSGYTNN